MDRHKIIRARARLGATQAELGELLGLGPSAVHRIERGARRPRGLVLEVCLALALALDRDAPLDALRDRQLARGERLAAIFRGAYGSR
ncbi:helix-turn-helix transcriptional regulator [Nannocystis bainbridge]|uniref:helix-turn-helix transcriptional regulator n=1 Tax=Nannocystis bainbridge TaxID=2995303 RepID=UPI00358DD7F0